MPEDRTAQARADIALLEALGFRWCEAEQDWLLPYQHKCGRDSEGAEK